jgi:phosphate starvation-inducible membrane PsiE
MLAKALIPLEFFVRMALTGVVFLLVHEYLGPILSLSLILFAAFIFLLVLSSALINLIMNRRSHRSRLAGQEK